MEDKEKEFAIRMAVEIATAYAGNRENTKEVIAVLKESYEFIYEKVKSG